MPAISVSFVVPTLNEASLLSKLLDSIEALEKTASVTVAECIIVDANSTDSTVEIASSYGCRIVEATPGNISRSRNTGAAQAEGEIVAFVDADCELPTNWLVRVAEQMSNSEVVAVGMTMGLVPQPSWIESTWFELAHKQQDNESASEVDWLPSFNVAVKKPAFQAVGGFDELLVTCEDYELGNRLKSLGKQIRLSSTDGVVHHGESKTIPEFIKREGWRARGEFYLLKENLSSVKVVLSFLIPLVVVGGILLAIALLLGSILGGAFSAAKLATVVFLGVVPVLLLVLRRRVAINRLLPSWGLLNVYFIARAMGLFRKFKRVERLS